MRSRHFIIPVILSFLFCGLGQIYLNRITKGLVLILSFLCAIIIIWIAVSDKEIKIISWGEKQLRFAPGQRSLSIHGQTYHVTDIMKVTGSIQLIFTWIFSVIDAWREGKAQKLQP